MYANLPACRNESLAGMQVAELSHDSFTMRMRTALTPARKLRKGKNPGEFSGAFDLGGFSRSLVSVIAGLDRALHHPRDRFFLDECAGLGRAGRAGLSLLMLSHDVGES